MALVLKLKTDADDFLAYEIYGKVRAKDHEEINNELEQAIKSHGRIRTLIQVDQEAFPGLRIFWKDLKFVLGHFGDVQRFATVGDKAWERWWLKMFGFLTPLRTKFFDVSQKDDAWNWVKEKA